MDQAEITRMANQIADYFSAYDHEEAVEGIADHIAKFWDPRMRRTLFDMMESGGSALDPLVVEAASRLAPASG
ncbi:formate dehydrogenase subunit delta [Amorphus orientalis]|uniref:Formate dehydrogenase subunit delta n=1 Tax=Amorphus orientalis TaxID=649198 RepID=A0AAE4AUP3_9HYPH|nr:formate dehydrogenase subunit delta [Amorphus orientalis]MDQ0316004.1 formate dehydrogenase subunit delta [Amorphus orientalis]